METLNDTLPDGVMTGEAFQNDMLGATDDTPDFTNPSPIAAGLPPEPERPSWQFWQKPEAETPPPQPEPAPLFQSAAAAPPPEPAPKETLPEDLTVDMFLLARNILQAEIFSYIAQSKNKERYTLDEEQLDMLAKVYAPLAAKYNGKIPYWVWILVVEAMTTGKLLLAALDERRVNRANKRAQKSAPVQAAVQQAENEPQERKNYEIDNNGYYIKDTKGAYIKVADRAEKADLADLKLILKDTDIKRVKAAFPDLEESRYA